MSWRVNNIPYNDLVSGKEVPADNIAARTAQAVLEICDGKLSTDNKHRKFFLQNKAKIRKICSKYGVSIKLVTRILK